MIKVKPFLLFLYILVFLTPIAFIEATINVPVSDFEVTIDGVFEYDEWIDAEYITLTTKYGGYVDLYIKYDSVIESLVFCVIADDYDYNDRDNILFLFDTQNDRTSYLNYDDFAVSINRQTYYSSNYGLEYDSVYASGNGSGYGELSFDPYYLPDPFWELIFERQEIDPGLDTDNSRSYGETWVAEIAMGLPQTDIQTDTGLVIGFGFEYFDYDYYGEDYTGSWYPSGLTDSPNSWETIIIKATEAYLIVSPVSPINDYNTQSSPVRLQASVTSGGSPIYNAIVDFYVDEAYAGTEYTDSNGYAYLDYYPVAEGTFTWYAEAYKSGYADGFSGALSFSYSTPLPEFSFLNFSPVDNQFVDESIVQLSARVNSDGSSVSGVRVDFYVDDTYIGYDSTDGNGDASYSYTASEGDHLWYVKASKTGYRESTSSSKWFTYLIQQHYLEIDSDVYVSGEGYYDDGEIVTLYASDHTKNPLILKRFNRWILDGTPYYSNSITLTMESDQVVSVIWDNDYSKLYIVGFLGLGIIASRFMIIRRNERIRLEAEKKALIDSEINSVRKGLRDSLLSENSLMPVFLDGYVSDTLSLEEVKKMLEEVASETGVKGWYVTDSQYLTKPTLRNRVQVDGSDGLEASNMFDLHIFANGVGVPLDAVIEITMNLIEDDKLEGYLTDDNKLVTDQYIQDKLKKHIG